MLPVLGSFKKKPYGLCCDSVCNISIVDMKNDRIHVIDKDGGFLHFVWYEGMKKPRTVCIDENENVYVVEWNTTSIKLFHVNLKNYVLFFALIHETNISLQKY